MLLIESNCVSTQVVHKKLLVDFIISNLELTMLLMVIPLRYTVRKANIHSDEQKKCYCYRCCQWFHVDCIPIAEGEQETLKSDHSPGMSTLPRILRDMACQPAARGEARHFTADNIWLVTKARKLLKSKRAQEKFTEDEEWSNDQWKCVLMEHFPPQKQLKTMQIDEKLTEIFKYLSRMGRNG